MRKQNKATMANLRGSVIAAPIRIGCRVKLEYQASSELNIEHREQRGACIWEESKAISCAVPMRQLYSSVFRNHKPLNMSCVPLIAIRCAMKVIGGAGVAGEQFASP